MLDFLRDQSTEIALDLGIGAVIWLVALALPFRELRARKEVGWDFLGYFGSGFFFVGMVIVLEQPILGWASPKIGGWLSFYGGWPWWIRLTSYILAADCGSYWAHRLLHTPRLWDSHAWHHSARYLYFLSGTRAAPIHLLVLLAPTSLAFLFFPDPAAVTVAFWHGVFQVANEHYIHSNLWVPFPSFLERVFVTPRFHFVHHSRDRKYSDSNYGFMFTMWDHLFGTYTDPVTVAKEEPLGLSYEISNWRAFFGLPQLQRRTDPPVLGEFQR